MLPEMRELIETFEPYVLWSDGDWEADPDYFGSKDFLAWLYNDSPVKDYVVTNDRWGKGCGKTHGGFWSGPDKWSPGHLVGHKWENAMTVDKNSWGNRKNIQIDEIIQPKELLQLLVSTVSCGGNILLNVGPSKEGTIIPIFQERLSQLGAWLKSNGEAIYSTHPWTHQNDSMSAQHEVWYTAGKGDLAGNVYALVIGWPKDEKLTLGSVQAGAGSTKIEFIGLDRELEFKQTSSGLQISFPSMSQVMTQCGLGCQWVYALRMKNVIPDYLEEYLVSIETY